MSDRELSLRLLLRHVVTYAPASLVPGAVTVMMAVIFTRLFDADEYGRYTVALATVTLSVALTGQWLKQGINRFLPVSVKRGDHATLRAAAVLAVTVQSTSWLAVGAAAHMLGFAPDRENWGIFILPAAALICFTSGVEVFLAMLQASMQAGAYSLFQVSTSVVRLLASVTIVLVFWRNAAGLLWGAVIAQVLVLPFLVRNAGVPPLSDIIQYRGVLGSTIRQLACYGLPMIGWYLCSTVLSLGDRYVIQITRGSSEVGIYAANYGLVAGAIGLLAAPVRYAAHPILMRAWAERNMDQVAEWLQKIVLWTLVIGTAAVGLLVLFARDIVGILLGPEFREGFLVVPIAMCGIVVWTAALYTHKPLEFSTRTRQMLWLAALAALINLALNILLVPSFGYMAAAVTTVVSYAVYFAITLRAGQDTVRWKMDVGKLVRYVAGITFGVAILLVLRTELARLWSLAGAVAVTAVGSVILTVVLVRRIHADWTRPNVNNSFTGRSGLNRS